MKTFIVVASLNVFIALVIYHRLFYPPGFLIIVPLFIILSIISKRLVIFAGILENQISDHQAIVINTIHRPPPCKSKYIILYNNSDASKEKFRTYINSLNLYAILDTYIDSDPNINYEIIESAITNAMDIHLAEQVVKFNSRKHPKKLG